MFTDLSKLNTRGVLQLPMKTFNYFLQHRSDTHILALEVLLVLALFCEAHNQDDKLFFCFRVFGACRHRRR